jgi:PilZ domain
MQSTGQVLTEVTVSWDGENTGRAAYLIHAAHNMLVLEAGDPSLPLPADGTPVTVEGPKETLVGKVAEHGRAGRFLVSLGDRPVRRANRMRVSLPALVRSAQLGESREVEIVDLTTGGARVRGIQAPVGSELNMRFTPPGREEPVTVRASVVHANPAAQQPWIGVAFRLVVLRGGRA